ncbi:MAG: YhdH/YhfP family quinone oxidoreductase [Vicinamibacterales bacterium]
MDDTYLAYRCHDEQGTIAARLERLPVMPADRLRPGEVSVRVAWSDINYKDALAVTGAGRIMRRLPLTAGIDLAGVVDASSDDRVAPGDLVAVIGCGLGEEHDGGYAERAVVKGDWVVPVPAPLTLRDAMAIGTAGFTAAQAIDRLEDNGTRPDGGPIAVTGATGGVGSLAVALLARAGYRVTAITGKADAEAYLRGLGAAEVMAASDVPEKTRPLEGARWAGAIDAVGGTMLHWLGATAQPLGSVASVGLAGGHALTTTVMPFILRGVNLLGVNSTYCPVPLRTRVWARLARDVNRDLVDAVVSRTVDLADLPGAFDGYTTRAIRGRTLVRVSGA